MDLSLESHKVSSKRPEKPGIEPATLDWQFSALSHSLSVYSLITVLKTVLTLNTTVLIIYIKMGGLMDD